MCKPKGHREDCICFDCVEGPVCYVFAPALLIGFALAGAIIWAIEELT